MTRESALTLASDTDAASLEEPNAVADAVASILDTPGPSELPPPLREIVVFRSATRRIVEANLDAGTEDYMLRNLGAMAAATEIPFMVLEAMEREILFAPPDQPGTWDYERRHRQLRGIYGDGGSCPVCFSRFASGLDLQRMARLRSEAVEEAKRRELQVHGGREATTSDRGTQ